MDNNLLNGTQAELHSGPEVQFELIGACFCSICLAHELLSYLKYSRELEKNLSNDSLPFTSPWRVRFHDFSFCKASYVQQKRIAFLVKPKRWRRDHMEGF